MNECVKCVIPYLNIGGVSDTLLEYVDNKRNSFEFIQIMKITMAHRMCKDCKKNGLKKCEWCLQLGGSFCLYFFIFNIFNLCYYCKRRIILECSNTVYEFSKIRKWSWQVCLELLPSVLWIWWGISLSLVPDRNAKFACVKEPLNRFILRTNWSLLNWEVFAHSHSGPSHFPVG